MKRVTISLIAALTMFSAAAQASDFTVGNLQIANPWTRATPKGSKVAGGYMVITNKGATPDRLMGGSSSVANRFEVHRMAMENGVMIMRPVEGGLEIKPSESVELKPGSFHVMFMDLKQPIEKGQRIRGTLEFEKAGKVDIEYVVEAIGATPAAKGGHHH